MALGIGYGLPFVAQHGTNPYKTQWAAALEGAKGAGATVEDENAGTGSCLVARGQEAYTDGLPATPSLLIVPQFYKAGNLYQDVPPFVAEDSTMRFAVSRNTTATRVNSSGLIASVASGVPRIDWLGQSCPALLVEASGQNLALQSEAFNVSGTWTLVTGGTGVNPAVTANAVISPDGTQNAETVVFNRGAGNTVSDQSTLEQILTLAASGTYTFSVYAKATTSGDVGKQIFLRAGSAGSLIAYTLTSSWVRLSRIETSIASGSNVVQIGSRGGFTADNSVSVDLWGAQVETGAIPTSYIPTTTAAVSRAADTIIASGALVSSLIGQTEGVLYCEFTLSSISDVIVVPNAYNSAQNYVGILHNGTNSLVLRIRYRSGGSNLNINFTQVATIGTTYKVAIGYKSGDSAAFVNGVQVGSTDTTAFAFENPLTLIEILVRQFYSSALFGPNRIRAVALYTTRLSNDQLAELTRLT
jgi:hypothetical protein